MTEIHGIWLGSPHPLAYLVLASLSSNYCPNYLNYINVINNSIHVKMALGI